MKGQESSGLGSPPHGRGIVLETESDMLTVRITPAWAGNSSLSSRLVLCIGITPAWAGNRAEKEKTRARAGDHPRMGGE